MKDPQDYTADAICRAMQLDRFLDTAWLTATHPVVRVLLTPSFHPEVCITFVGGREASLLIVTALQDQFWAAPGGSTFLKHEERSTVSCSALGGITELFEASVAATGFESRTISLDGMGAKSCCVREGKVHEIECHLSSSSKYGFFVMRVIRLAWESCRNPYVRNALARSSEYLADRLPFDSEPPRKPVTRVMVLGAPDERSSYFEGFRKENG